MMQGSNKPKNEGKPAGGPPLESMTAEKLARHLQAWKGEKETWLQGCKPWLKR